MPFLRVEHDIIEPVLPARLRSKWTWRFGEHELEWFHIGISLLADVLREGERIGVQLRITCGRLLTYLVRRR